MLHSKVFESKALAKLYHAIILIRMHVKQVRNLDFEALLATLLLRGACRRLVLYDQEATIGAVL